MRPLKAMGGGGGVGGPAASQGNTLESRGSGRVALRAHSISGIESIALDIRSCRNGTRYRCLTDHRCSLRVCSWLDGAPRRAVWGRVADAASGPEKRELCLTRAVAIAVRGRGELCLTRAGGLCREGEGPPEGCVWTRPDLLLQYGGSIP